MAADLERTIRELKDRQDIYDCLMRYSRGVDRLDRAMLETVYHSDAVDDHGAGLYVGSASGFIDWVLGFHGKHQRRTQHAISNYFCDLDGDTAHVESYWTYSAINVEPPHHSTMTGRYVDRFEKRKGEWRIAVRVCVLTTSDAVLDPDGMGGDMHFAPTSRDRKDVAYQRPLQADRSRFMK